VSKGKNLNRLLSIHLEVDHNWEGCGLCMHSLDVGIQNKYLWKFLKPRRNISIRDLQNDIKNTILEEVCTDLRQITEEDLESLVKVKRYRGLRKPLIDEDFDPFYSDIGYFLWGMVIVFLDIHMQDRVRLRGLLKTSLARSYLSRMEEHSKDYGSQ